MLTQYLILRGKKEIYIAASIHILAGSLVGLLSLIPAITFFMIDRLLTRRKTNI